MAKTAHPSPFNRVRRVDGEYSQSLTHDGHKVVIYFNAESKEELEKILPAAVKFWQSRVRWFKAFRDYAATELLDSLNGNLDCGEDDPVEVTASQLRKLLPAPFSIRFTLLSRWQFPLSKDDDPNQVIFEMAGGKSKKVLQENCLTVTGNLEEGITDGDVDTLL